MFYDEELFWLSFGDIITNIVTITVITLEVGLVIWLLLRWLKKNLNWAPVVNIGGLSRGGKTYGNSPIEMVEEKDLLEAQMIEAFMRAKYQLSIFDHIMAKNELDFIIGSEVERQILN